MITIKINKQEYPHDFGMSFIRNLRLNHGLDFFDQAQIEKFVNAPVSDQSEMMMAICATALNEGARKNKTSETYTIVDVCDLVDSDPDYIQNVMIELGKVFSEQKKNKSTESVEGNQ